MTTIRKLAVQLSAGEISARQLVDQSLDRISDPAGEGGRAFLSVAADKARLTADTYDTLRRNGGVVPPFAGIPVAIKDLCDIEGQVTTAGSVILADQPAAPVDAPVVARLRAAGFIPIGRTNMTEFAYSGLGLNAHYDTPRSPWDRTTGRIPGGSSSGTAVAVGDEMVVAGLGTDTGGSCRIPAAFCGIVGYKPTASRIPLDGIVPLSASLDSVGPLASSVDCCAIVDAVFAGEPVPQPGAGDVPAGRPADRIRLAVLTDHVLDDIDQVVADGFNAALSHLSAAGVGVVEVSFPELLDLPDINRTGGLATAEAYHWHRSLLATKGDGYDQRVRRRIEPGAKISAADYLDVVAARVQMIERARITLAGFDAFVLPSVAVVAPTVASFESGDPDYYSKMNLLCLRNTSVGNFLDACAISVPASRAGEPPVSLMLMAGPGADHQLFSLARTVESLLLTARGG
ncbi:MAG: amidase [Actinomycetia bacterium]|nr:amidase [Actinomycetes bacterium]